MNKADKYLIRKVYEEELDEAFTLIWNVFQQFVAPDYTKEGIDYFYEQFVKGQSFRDEFLNGLQTMYGMFDDSRMVGVSSISRDNHVSCVFVDGNYQRKGIATKLFSEVISKLKRQGTEKIRLNASPYGVPFYHAIGFSDIDTEKVYHGIRYTPMELRL
ncbi:MAG: GNAT family N-acetyltransferase [Lachnospiraceae bacterium]|nr:GNAT family N-acetyltransferase [Lachnospiraceae bacterium]